jgi:4-hydroxy-tetrahydrodipicolinate synthase
MLEHAEKVGCDTALLGFSPNYYPHNAEEIYQVAKQMADSTNLGLVLYPSPHFNFERFHPSGFSPELLERMADFENVVAVKIGEPGLAAECNYRFGDRILVNNPVERMLPLMYQACKQQWIGAGCYEVFQSPEKPYLVQYFQYLRENKMEEAFSIYWELTPVRVMFERKHRATAMLGTYNWTLQKYYQWLVGGNGGYTRQPCMKIHQHDMEPHKFALMKIGITPRQPDEEFYYGRLNYGKMKKGKL